MLKLLVSYPFPKNNLWEVNKEKGFTLIELILSLAISSILILCIYSVLDFTVKACKVGEEEDRIMLNGQYAMEYIKEEIRGADKIISIDYFKGIETKYKNNIGFVIMQYSPNKTFSYNYSTYYLKDNKLYRIAENMKTDVLPKSSSFSGHNLIAENVVSIENTNINFQNKTIDLNFILKGDLGKEKEFKTKIYIRCPIMD